MRQQSPSLLSLRPGYNESLNVRKHIDPNEPLKTLGVLMSTAGLMGKKIETGKETLNNITINIAVDKIAWREASLLIPFYSHSKIF